MFRKNYKNLIYLFFLIIPLYIFFKQPAILNPVKFKIVQIFSAPSKFVLVPIKEFKKILYYHRIYDEYIKLRGEVDTLKTRLIGMDEVIKENTRLEKLLDFKRKLIYSSVAANVIGRNPSRWNSSMIIDKGLTDGLKEGQPVVSASGVVGKIAEVSENKSKVILLTDPQFSIFALVKKPRESGLVSGTLQGVCRLKYLSKDSKIQIGDSVITSKLSSSFPEGLLIGEIIGKEAHPRTPSPEYIVQPTVSFSQIEEVLVILR